MKGVSVGVTMAGFLCGCAAGGWQQGPAAVTTQARLVAADRNLAQSAPEIQVMAGAESAEVCRMQLVTGTRIPRLRCDLMSPSEAALVEMQTDDEIEYAREQQLLDEALRIEASLGHARTSW